MGQGRAWAWPGGGAGYSGFEALGLWSGYLVRQSYASSSGSLDTTRIRVKRSATLPCVCSGN